MFRRIFFAIFFVFSIDVKGAEEPKDDNASQKATLIIHREKLSPPFSFKPLIEINTVKAFYLPRGYHAKLILEPGAYHIQSNWKAAHGVSDGSLDIDLRAGETTYVAMNSWLGGRSNLKESKRDLTKSREVTRFHPQWTLGGNGGYVTEETLNERYDITINTEKLLEDFSAGDDAQKMELAKYLIRREIYDETLLIEFEKAALHRYKNNILTKLEAQPLAFMFKYVASSRLPEFKASIAEIKLNAKSKYVRKYAKNYLYLYYGEE